MFSIVPNLARSVKEKMSKRFRKCSIAAVRVRYLIIFNLWNGRGARLIETLLGVHNTTVYRVAKRFRELGEASLWDGREDNGAEKLSETFLGVLDVVVRSSPLDYGWRRRVRLAFGVVESFTFALRPPNRLAAVFPGRASRCFYSA